MSAVVFIGPTLSAVDASLMLPAADLRGPAGCGDVYLAVRQGYRSIALIDGYFEHKPSVWHKELLWALSAGVCVYGAASMGALRAAELEPFGMIGVGRVFEQFRDGELADDDEVAVAHEARERGYRAVSEAMVNIRATVRLAADEGVIGEDDQQWLLGIAKGLFYAERGYDALRRCAMAQGPNLPRLAAFWTWLAERGGVNQKRDDACSLFARLTADLRGSAGPPQPTFEFEYTDAWHAFRQRMDARVSDRGTASLSVDSEALLRALALELAKAEGVTPTAEQVQAHSEVLRRRLGLLTPGATGAWLSRHQLDLLAFSRLVYEDWLAEQCREKAVALGAAQGPAVAALRDGSSPRSGAV